MTYDEILAAVRSWPLVDQIRLMDEIYLTVVNSDTEWSEKIQNSNWAVQREQWLRWAELKVALD